MAKEGGTMKAPCYKCPDRVMHCHSTCEKYIEYSKFKETERAIRYQETEIKMSHAYNTHAAVKKINRR